MKPHTDQFFTLKSFILGLSLKHLLWISDHPEFNRMGHLPGDTKLATWNTDQLLKSNLYPYSYKRAR